MADEDGSAESVASELKETKERVDAATEHQSELAEDAIRSTVTNDIKQSLNNLKQTEHVEQQTNSIGGALKQAAETVRGTAAAGAASMGRNPNPPAQNVVAPNAAQPSPANAPDNSLKAAKTEAAATQNAAKRAAGATMNAARTTANATKSAANKAMNAGAKVVGAGKAVVGAGKWFVNKSALPTFFFLTFALHILDLTAPTLLGAVDYSFPGILNRRFFFYVGLSIIAYFWIFHKGGSFNWRAFGMCFLISGISFILPSLTGLGFMPTDREIRLMITFALIILPPWPIYLMFATDEFERFRTIYIIILVIILIALLMVYFGAKTASNVVGWNLDTGGAVGLVWGKLLDAGNLLWEQNRGLPGRLGSAGKRFLASFGGEYYMGMVDENENEPVGIYLSDVRMTQPKYYEDEPVSVYATLKGKNLDLKGREKDPIKVKMYCDASGPRGEVLPQNVIEVYNYVEQQIDCLFPSGKLGKGSHTIKLNVDFTFTTMSYYKTYFMDRERKRDMTSQDIDIFSQYEIGDRQPIAIFSNGPVHIGMQVDKDLPVGLYSEFTSTSGNNDFRLGMTFDNYWMGKVTKVDRVVIMLPTKEFEIVKDPEPGPNDIDTFCGGYTFKLCDQLTVAEQEESTECTEFIEDHNVYVYYLKYALGDKTKDIDISETYQTLRCNIGTTSDGAATVLGATPISTKYFKVTADYEYELEESIYVNVEEVEGYKAVTLEGQTCTEKMYSDKGPMVDNTLRASYADWQGKVKKAIKTPSNSNFKKAHMEAMMAAIMSRLSGAGTIDNKTDRNKNNQVDYLMGGISGTGRIDKTLKEIDIASGELVASINKYTTAVSKDSINYIFLQSLEDYYDKIKNTFCEYDTGKDKGLCNSNPSEHKKQFVNSVFDFYTKWLNTLCYAGKKVSAVPSGYSSSVGGGPLTWPVPGHYRVISCYGKRPNVGPRYWHQGIDIGSTSGGPGHPKPSVVAVAPGVVVYARDNSDGVSSTSIYGNLIILEHDDPQKGIFYSGYAHLDSILVTRGSSVNQNEIIAKMGESGLKDGGIHLHFFMYFGDHNIPVGGITTQATGSHFTYDECKKDAQFGALGEICNPMCHFTESVTYSTNPSCQRSQNPIFDCPNSQGTWPTSITGSNPGAVVPGATVVSTITPMIAVVPPDSISVSWNLADAVTGCWVSAMGTSTTTYATPGSSGGTGAVTVTGQDYSATFSGLAPGNYKIKITCTLASGGSSLVFGPSNDYVIAAGASVPVVPPTVAGCTDVSHLAGKSGPACISCLNELFALTKGFDQVDVCCVDVNAAGCLDAFKNGILSVGIDNSKFDLYFSKLVTGSSASWDVANAVMLTHCDPITKHTKCAGFIPLTCSSATTFSKTKPSYCP
ncbi:peptidoglycan DD-metalloendopeptidase family protein [Candidatus Woesearchaeota archaeon]|jgi:murein DD-endopeptidase MepM/ murein hydrolase activator NlpD|nr:peptidoglycan DD-metalloendopeptidase family protein [Candidatus Woesearchaeota archaeon]MBT3537277.1 peptidoglycan DD-metalloendopeptidase family protein [Candidatus Woesearchaeota archaeon]MBT4696774.1 peptidoglycan DD-metalloendopeptidase family protein [Candidatus Woesearchaeota archaeon]MBT4716757.1 peptidoglycan DD-metalloendopeptidase family protein [Candidatus Woesearchaeota archaeon]MBT7106413.1 peptidoglycan DD-metalloendopeptidase family protein [Candidatus Woesearchaeota archaeon